MRSPPKSSTTDPIDEVGLTDAHDRRFRQAVRTLNKLLTEIQAYAPDANYYLSTDTLHILSGDSHDLGGSNPPRYDRILTSMRLVRSSGGDW